jgi:uncharacterized protein (DUF1810 family)
MTDVFDLQRFVAAQDPVYAQITTELRRGRKTSHWMWFVFPQLSGLGSSYMARHYAISGPDEAKAYAAHHILGARLTECTQLVLDVENATAHEIFGSPDDLKFRSCMTLFSLCAEEPAIFQAALDRYFEGVPDPMTVSQL